MIFNLSEIGILLVKIVVIFLVLFNDFFKLLDFIIFFIYIINCFKIGLLYFFNFLSILCSFGLIFRIVV